GRAVELPKLVRPVSWLDRLELLERLAAAAAVADRPAWRGAEDVLQRRVGRAAVGAAEDAAPELDEARGACLARRRRREARRPRQVPRRAMTGAAHHRRRIPHRRPLVDMPATVGSK